MTLPDIDPSAELSDAQLVKLLEEYLRQKEGRNTAHFESTRVSREPVIEFVDY